MTPPVWDLFAKAVQHVGDVPVLIEWDNDIPEFSRLMQEADTAKQIQHKNLAAAASV